MFDQVTIYHQGARVGFFRGDVTKLLEDVQELRPTVFPSVPRLFNRIYDKLIQVSYGVFSSPVGINIQRLPHSLLPFPNNIGDPMVPFACKIIQRQ